MLQDTIEVFWGIGFLYANRPVRKFSSETMGLIRSSHHNQIKNIIFRLANSKELLF